MKVKAMRAQVLVKVDKIEDKSKGGIIIARKLGGMAEQNARETGTIVRIGPLAFCDHKEGEERPKVGDRVIFQRYAGTFADEDQTHRLMADEFILGVIED